MKDKKSYENPTLELLMLGAADIIRTSGEDDMGEWDEDLN